MKLDNMLFDEEQESLVCAISWQGTSHLLNIIPSCLLQSPLY